MNEKKPKPLPGTAENAAKLEANIYWSNQDPKYADLKGEITVASKFSLLNGEAPINQIVKIIGEYQDGASADICLFTKAKL